MPADRSSPQTTSASGPSDTTVTTTPSPGSMPGGYPAGAVTCGRQRRLLPHAERLRVLHHHVGHGLKLAARAELDELGSFFDGRRVAVRDVERVAGFEHLFAVGEAIRDLAFEHVSPVRARTAVARQPFEERRGVDRLAHREEIDRVVVEVFVPVL